MDADADASTPSALRLAKQALRGRVLAAREDLSPRAREAESAAIRARLLALPSFSRAGCMLLTLPFRGEWDTRPLVEHALRDGRRIALPRVDRETRRLVLHEITDLKRDVIAGYVGVPEPRPALPVVRAGDIDWVLVPGVAFDASCRRLGYGGGFFDRLLPAIRIDAPRIAGAFDVQIVDEVPAGPLDQRVDAVATPSAYIGGVQ